jgi:hypothetical protein
MRSPISANESIKLKINIKDSLNVAKDPENLTLYLTRPDSTELIYQIDDFIRVDVGFYYLDFNITDLPGVYHELWEITLNGNLNTKTFSFQCLDNPGFDDLSSHLGYNRLISIQIQDSIEDLDGLKISNLEDEYHFCTEFNPFYAPVEILRVECGVWMNDIPDETIALAIHWSSKKADDLTCKKPVNGEHYYYALTRFVLYDAAISLFTMPVGTYSSNSKTHKTLGDLSVQAADVDIDVKDLLKEYKDQRDEWLRVINSGGAITFGQSFDPTTARKGFKRPDYLPISRQWHDPWGEYYDQPSANAKYRKPGEEKYKSGFTRWNQYYFTTTRVGKGRS